MKKLIIDTNFLMLPYQFKIDIFSEFDRICHFNYSLFIIENSIDELNFIFLKSKGRDKRAAKLGIEILESKIKSKDIGLIKCDGGVDQAILLTAGEGTVVATLDKKLKQMLLQKGVPVIIMRGQKYLQLVGI